MGGGDILIDDLAELACDLTGRKHTTDNLSRAFAARHYDQTVLTFHGTQCCQYVANLGVLAALSGPGDVILLDADCHASIYDGCRLGGADVIRFRHNDVNDLEKTIEPILAMFIQQRQPFEAFGDFCDRVGSDAIRAPGPARRQDRPLRLVEGAAQGPSARWADSRSRPRASSRRAGSGRQGPAGGRRCASW